VIRNPSDGNYQISAQKAGYISRDAAPMIPVSGDRKSTSVTVRLTRQAVIEGSVVDQSGSGLPSASVQLFRWSVSQGRRHLQQANQLQTDEIGHFRLYGLAAGRYYVGATAAATRRANSASIVYPPVLYPGATDIHGAQPLDLEPGGEEQVQIRLHTARGYRVRGRVIPEVRYTSVWLRPSEPDVFPLSPLSGAVWDEKTNTFTISGVPPGAYELGATSQIDGLQRSATKAIVVGDSDIEGITVTLDPVRELNGKVTLEGGPAPAGAVSQVNLQRPGQNMFGANVEQDGNFHLSGVPPGLYELVIWTSGAFYVRSIRQGGLDIPQARLEIRDLPPEPLAIDLGSHGATIRGAVAVPETASHAAIAVRLFRASGGIVFEKQMYFTPSPAKRQRTISDNSPSRAWRRATTCCSPGDPTWNLLMPSPISSSDTKPRVRLFTWRKGPAWP
jgi:hypothetical protein